MKTKTFFNTNRFENETDIFSSLFEIPVLTKEMLLGKTLSEVADEYNVSKERLELRLKFLQNKVYNDEMRCPYERGNLQ